MNADREALLHLFAQVLETLERGDFPAAISTIVQAFGMESEADCESEEFRAACEATFQSQSPEAIVAQNLCIILALALFDRGHGAAGTNVMSGVFGGLPPDSAFDFRRIDTLSRATPEIRWTALGSLARAMQFLERLPDLRETLQNEMSIPDVLSTSTDEVVRALRSFLDADVATYPSRLARLELIAMLASSAADSRPDVASSLLEAALDTRHLSDEEIAGAPAVADADGWMLVTAYLCHPLLVQGKWERCVAFIEPLLERGGDFGAREFRFRDTPQADVSLAGEAHDYRISLAAYYLSGLRLSGRQDEARRLAVELCRSPFWLEEPTVGTGALLAVGELGRLLAKPHPELARDVRDRVLDDLRNAYGFDRVAFWDRIAAASRSTEPRRVLVALGNSIALAWNGDDGDAVRRRNLEIDSWLTQQTHLLTFLSGRPALRLDDGPAAIRGREAAWNRERKEPPASSELPSHRLEQFYGSLRGMDGETIVREPAESFDAAKRSRWKEDRVRDELPRLIGSDTVLLRAGFSLEGELCWTLFRAEEGAVSVAAHEPSKHTSDEDRFVATLQAFDRRFGMIEDLAKDLSTLRPIERTRIHLAMRDRIGAGTAIPSRPDDRARLESTLTRLPRVFQRFVAEFGEVNLHHRRISASAWTRWWNDAFDSLTSLIDSDLDMAGTLDRMTVDLLTALEDLFGVAALFDALRPDDHLVIWPSDALLSVPFAFLRDRRVEEESPFLFERVATIRTTVSPCLDEWMQSEEELATRDGKPRLLSVSHFDHATPLHSRIESRTENRLGELFHRLEASAGERYEWLAAGGPSGVPGSHDVVARSLSAAAPARVALLAICGHGHNGPQGVSLEDGVWNGAEVWRWDRDSERWRVRSACDLSNADFVIQLSCSIGRLRQFGMQDVEGFCVELFVNRARSVFAGRWTLFADEAIDFAEGVARAYLAEHDRVLESGGSLTRERVRAGAVAAARRDWATSYRSGEGNVSLSTAAALDHFGLP